MARVIGEDTTIYRRISCKECAALIEYTPAEVQKQTGKDYSGGSCGWEWIICPRCAKDVYVNSW